MQKTQVIIAESSQLFQIGIRSILSERDDIELLTITNSSEELFDYLDDNRPHVVVIDYNSKHYNLKTVERLSQSFKNVNLLGITGEKNADVILKGIRHGIISYVKKECSASEIVDAIVATGKGEKFFCGELLESLKDNNLTPESIEEEALNCEPVSLSERELEIIEKIAEGYTNAQIAVLLYISLHTVNTHRKNIMKKLGINNTASIVLFAVKSGLVTPANFRGIPELDESSV